ncbi:MAG: alpha/beta hydrolase [Candidatus Dormibacteraceae bacterium]
MKARALRPLALAGSVAGLLAGTALATQYATPWPAALLIRTAFEEGGRRTARETARHAPTAGVRARLGLRLGSPGGPACDVFTPAAGAEALPAVCWIHGGSWISGSRSDVAPYLRIIASHGFTAVGLDYSVAPERRYPTPLHELLEVLGRVIDHAADLRVDPSRIVLAGDSAGAQLASQVAVAIREPAYAERIGVRPTVAPEQLRAVVLHCGVYDLPAVERLGRLLQWGLNAALWAYTGRRRWTATRAATEMSTITQVTAAFPPTYVGAGNGDPLTRTQSIPFAWRLRGLGVPVTERFWDRDHRPALPHEFQFHLDRPEARQVLAETLDFLRAAVCPEDPVTPRVKPDQGGPAR